jgi:dihydrofolate reductase
MTAPISIIVAVGRNGIIGTGNRLPWPRIQADMDWFRRHTLSTPGQPVIMGRRTWESLGGKGLPDRFNIVVSRTLSRDSHANTIVCRTIKDARWAALDTARRIGATGEAFVIGGAEIYRAFLPLVQTIYLTEVDAEPAGDARFDFDRAGWRETVAEQHAAAGGAPACIMKVLERV